MALRDMTPFEGLRSLVEPIERALETPWTLSRADAIRINVEETPKEVIVSAKLPEFKRDGISVDVTETALTIRGRRSDSQGHRKHGQSRASERMEFVHRFTLPVPVKREEVRATFDDDLLEIRLPRAKEAQTRSIKIS